MGDDVHHVAVAFDGAEVGDFHRAKLSDAPDIVACEVDEHEMFGCLFRIRQERGGVGIVFCDGGAAPFGSGDGADFDETVRQAHVNFRGRSDEGECVVKSQAEHVGGRVNVAQRAVEGEWVAWVIGDEPLRGNDLEDVACADELLHFRDDAPVLVG